MADSILQTANKDRGINQIHLHSSNMGDHAVSGIKLCIIFSPPLDKSAHMISKAIAP
jgi:hypothetical protein